MMRMSLKEMKVMIEIQLLLLEVVGVEVEQPMLLVELVLRMEVVQEVVGMQMLMQMLLMNLLLEVMNKSLKGDQIQVVVGVEMLVEEI